MITYLKFHRFCSGAITFLTSFSIILFWRKVKFGSSKTLTYRSTTSLLIPPSVFIAVRDHTAN
jgi:hypothetical protein